MEKLNLGLPPKDLHYAKLLAALCRSARDNPPEQRALVMSGVVRSIWGNSEPERTGIANFVLLELSAPDAHELTELIASGTGASVLSPLNTGTPPIGRRERRRHLTGDALSTPWLAARERRRRA